MKEAIDIARKIKESNFSLDWEKKESECSRWELEIEPHISNFESKHHLTCDFIVKSFIRDYFDFNRHRLVGNFKTNSIGLNKGRLKSYAWATIFKVKDGIEKTPYKNSPQLVLSINENGIATSFSYGKLIEKNNSSIRIFQEDTNIQNYILNNFADSIIYDRGNKVTKRVEEFDRNVLFDSWYEDTQLTTIIGQKQIRKNFKVNLIENMDKLMPVFLKAIEHF